MPRPAQQPALRRHKASDRAYAVFQGRRVYFGRWGTDDAQRAFDRTLADWLSRGRRFPEEVESGLCIAELVLAFLREQKRRLSRTEFDNYRLAVAPLLHCYGDTLARDFGPRALKAVRRRIVDRGCGETDRSEFVRSRTYVNSQVRRIRRIFKWACSEELVPPEIYHGLQSVEGVRRGDDDVRDDIDVRPVERSDVDAVLPHVSRQVGAMIELQWLTGMRPGEVCQMRTADLDTSGSVWFFRPRTHKTQHHGHRRLIAIGPQGQELLRPWLRLDREAFLFQPCEAEAERNAERRRNRKTPMTPSHSRRKRKRAPMRHPAGCYTTISYRRAIHRACDRAAIDRWSPHRLRHSAATRIRREHGLDAARAVLGHRSPVVTEIYGELDELKAVEVAKAMG